MPVPRAVHKNRFPFSRFSSGHARNELANRTWPIVTCHSNFWNCFTILRHPFAIDSRINWPPSSTFHFFLANLIPHSRVFVNILNRYQLFHFERDTSSLANDELTNWNFFLRVRGNFNLFFPLASHYRTRIWTCFSSSSFPRRMLIESKIDELPLSRHVNTRARRLFASVRTSRISNFDGIIGWRFDFRRKT